MDFFVGNSEVVFRLTDTFSRHLELGELLSELAALLHDVLLVWSIVHILEPMLYVLLHRFG